MSCALSSKQLRCPGWLLGLLLFATAGARAETKLDFWHSYRHQPSGVVHYSFQIANYKRGLFFGSCGPSTRSLQWEYDIDLAGPGPIYQGEQIAINSDGKKIEVASGKIVISSKDQQATIELKVKSGTVVLAFPGNGSHPIKKLR